MAGVFCMRGGCMLCIALHAWAFSSILFFYFRNLQLISEYNCNLKALLRQEISYPELYGDVIYKLRNINGHNHFLTMFNKSIRNLLKGDLILLYYKPLQFAITLSSFHERRQEGFSTLWRSSPQILRRKGVSDPYHMSFLSYRSLNY